jgi:ubiquitin C-terminal hydrolase
MYEFCSESLQSQLQTIRSKSEGKGGRFFYCLPACCSIFSIDSSSSSSSEPRSPSDPTNRSGKYRLFSVVCHKGRNADSGHYVSIVRDAKAENRWWKFDDTEVSAINTEEVLSLKGGGDKEMVYLCVYTAM